MSIARAQLRRHYLAAPAHCLAAHCNQRARMRGVGLAQLDVMQVQDLVAAHHDHRLHHCRRIAQLHALKALSQSVCGVRGR